jgi:hypothetical protein
MRLTEEGCGGHQYIEGSGVVETVDSRVVAKS